MAAAPTSRGPYLCSPKHLHLHRSLSMGLPVQTSIWPQHERSGFSAQLQVFTEIWRNEHISAEQEVQTLPVKAKPERTGMGKIEKEFLKRKSAIFLIIPELTHTANSFSPSPSSLQASHDTFILIPPSPQNPLCWKMVKESPLGLRCI